MIRIIVTFVMFVTTAVFSQTHYESGIDNSGLKGSDRFFGQNEEPEYTQRGKATELFTTFKPQPAKVSRKCNN